MRARLLPLPQVTPALREAWDDLAAHALEPNPFFEAAAVLPAGRLLTGGADVALLVVEDGDRLELALPVRRAPGPRRVPVPALRSWMHPYCFLGTPLARPERLRQAWDEALDLLVYGRLQDEPWLGLDRLALHGPVAVALQDALLERHDRVWSTDRFGRPVLRRRAEPTYLRDRISARHLRTLRRQRRRLGEELGGAVEVVDRAADLSRVPAAVDVMLDVEQRGWKGRSGTALASRPGDAEYFRQMCSAFAVSGRLQVWTLGHADAVAACQVNVVAGEAVFHVKIAYEEEFARFSPGLQLELAMIDEFHVDERLAWIDSCVDPGNRVSTQLYPDREVLGTVLVPLRGLGAAAVRAERVATAVGELTREPRRRVAARLRERPAR